MTARTHTALRTSGFLVLLILLTALIVAGLYSLRFGTVHAAVVVEVPPEIARTPVPHVPADVVARAVEDSTREHGWALAVIVGVILISRALKRARGRWPASRALDWAGGKVGIALIGAGVVCSAALDALVLGGSWTAAGLAAIGTVLYLLDPDQRPSLAARDFTDEPPTQAGFVAGTLLVWLATLALLVAGAGLASCSGVQRAAGSVVDCATGSAPSLTSQFGPLADDAIAAATREDGSIDVDRLKRAARNFAWDTAGCVFAVAIARAMAVSAPRGLLATPGGPKPAQLRAAWEAVRAEQLGGRRFELAGGTVM